MTDISAIIKSYTLLDTQKKTEKLITLLEVFATYKETIPKIIQLLKEEKLSEMDMIDIYTMFVTTIQQVKNEDLQKSLNKLDELHEKILKIQQEEAQEKEKEGNPENLFKNI